MGNCLTSGNASYTLPNSSSHSDFDANTNSVAYPNPNLNRKRAVSTGRVPAKILPFSSSTDVSSLYILGHELGRGQFGVIRHCTSRATGLHYACKSISKLRLCTPRDVQEVRREILIMSHLSTRLSSYGPSSSPASIVSLHQVIEDESSVHLIMELCHGGELYDRIVLKKRFSEDRAAPIFKSLMETVQFCHSMGVIHRDLKPENILLVDDSETSAIKVADFGLALQFVPGQKFTGMAGSAYYVAPEVLRGEYSQEIDVWSAGVVLYVLLSGVPPFWGASEQAIFKAIEKGDLDFHGHPWDQISASAKDLIRKMLCADVKLRITPAQVLKHPWILHYTKENEQTSKNLSQANNNLQTSSPMTFTDSCKQGMKTPEKISIHKHGMRKVVPSEALLCQATDVNNMTIALSQKNSELDAVLQSLIASLNKPHQYLLSNSAKMNLKGGWTVTLLTANVDEQTLILESGNEVYFVSHDRVKQKIGWKKLDRENVYQKNDKLAHDSSKSFMPQMQVVF